jgi:metal-responsive CopG/Arc/MetJ family transcriptional regulator
MARTHVVMADEVLEAIDEKVGERGRSRFLEDAAREKLERIELEEALRSTKGIAKGKAYSHWRDRGSAATWVREGRRSDRRA